VSAMGWAGTLIIVSRLSVRDWGRFSFTFAFLGLLNVFTGITNPRIVLRALEDDDGTLVGTYVLLRLAVGVFAYAVAVGFVALAGYPTVVLYATLVAGLALIIGNVSYGYDVLFQFWMKLPQVALAGALGQAIQLGLIVVLALTHSSLVIFTVPAVACEVVALLWKLYRLPPRPRLRYHVVWRRWLELAKFSLPLAIGDALGILYYNLDMVMLSKLGTFRSVAIYSVAYKFAGVLLIVPQAVGTAIFPIAVRYWPREPARFRALIRQAARLYLAIAAAVTVEFVIFAPQAISLLYGHRYAVGTEAARLVVASECLGFFTSLAIMTLVAANRNVFYPLAALVGLFVNFGLNLWLIPALAYVGSAWATIVTETLVAVSLWVPVSRVTSARFIEPSGVAKVATCAVVMGGVALGLQSLVPWFVAAAVAAGIYVLAVILMRVGGERDLHSLVSLEQSSAVTD
jgi:O-antigen/teichoic acid export membrane protein